MSNMLMKYFGWQNLSEQIQNHGVCGNMFNRYLKTLNSLFNNQKLEMCFDFDELRLFLEYYSAVLLSPLILNSLSIPLTMCSSVIKFCSCAAMYIIENIKPIQATGVADESSQKCSYYADIS